MKIFTLAATLLSMFLLAPALAKADFAAVITGTAISVQNNGVPLVKTDHIIFGDEAGVMRWNLPVVLNKDDLRKKDEPDTKDHEYFFDFEIHIWNHDDGADEREVSFSKVQWDVLDRNGSPFNFGDRHYFSRDHDIGELTGNFGDPNPLDNFGTLESVVWKNGLVQATEHRSDTVFRARIRMDQEDQYRGGIWTVSMQMSFSGVIAVPEPNCFVFLYLGLFTVMMTWRRH